MRFSRLLEKIHHEKHTGPVLVHFAGGIPRSVEVLRPSIRISLDSEPSGAKLDDDRTLANALRADASAIL